MPPFLLAIKFMCKITDLKPDCGYNIEGLNVTRMLDVRDYVGVEYVGGQNYDNGTIQEIKKTGWFVNVATPDTAKYTASKNGKIYTHVLDTFIPALSGEMQAQLNQADRERYVVVFQQAGGKFAGFGFDAGAKVTFTNQTADVTGSVLTLTAQSIYPLFEVLADTAADQFFLIDNTGAFITTQDGTYITLNM